MKEYQAPQIEVTVFEVEDIVTTSKFSSFSLDNFGGWDFVEKNGKSGSSDLTES